MSSAVRGGLALPDLLDQALERIVAQTGALAGTISILTNGGEPVTVRRPDTLAPGLGWLAPLLDEPFT